MNSGKVVLGVLAGIAAGTILGILFAPDKGSETRKKIIGKGEGFAESVKDEFDDLASSLKEKIETIVKEARIVAENIKQKTAEH